MSFQLIDEGKISPSVLGAGSVEPLDSKSGRVDKRRRYMDLCVQVTPGGSYKARPCWKGGGYYVVKKGVGFLENTYDET